MTRAMTAKSWARALVCGSLLLYCLSSTTTCAFVVPKQLVPVRRETSLASFTFTPGGSGGSSSNFGNPGGSSDSSSSSGFGSSGGFGSNSGGGAFGSSNSGGFGSSSSSSSSGGFGSGGLGSSNSSPFGSSSSGGSNNSFGSGGLGSSGGSTFGGSGSSSSSNSFGSGGLGSSSGGSTFGGSGSSSSSNSFGSGGLGSSGGSTFGGGSSSSSNSFGSGGSNNSFGSGGLGSSGGSTFGGSGSSSSSNSFGSGGLGSSSSSTFGSGTSSFGSSGSSNFGSPGSSGGSFGGSGTSSFGSGGGSNNSFGSPGSSSNSFGSGGGTSSFSGPGSSSSGSFGSSNSKNSFGSSSSSFGGSGMGSTTMKSFDSNGMNDNFGNNNGIQNSFGGGGGDFGGGGQFNDDFSGPRRPMNGRPQQFETQKQFSGGYRIGAPRGSRSRNPAAASEMPTLRATRNPAMTSPARALLPKQWQWKQPNNGYSQDGRRVRYKLVETFSGDMKTVPVYEDEYDMGYYDGDSYGMNPNNPAPYEEDGRLSGTGYAPTIRPRPPGRNLPRQQGGNFRPPLPQGDFERRNYQQRQQDWGGEYAPQFREEYEQPYGNENFPPPQQMSQPSPLRQRDDYRPEPSMSDKLRWEMEDRERKEFKKDILGKKMNQEVRRYNSKRRREEEERYRRDPDMDFFYEIMQEGDNGYIEVEPQSEDIVDKLASETKKIARSAQDFLGRLSGGTYRSPNQEREREQDMMDRRPRGVPYRGEERMGPPPPPPPPPMPQYDNNAGESFSSSSAVRSFEVQKRPPQGQQPYSMYYDPRNFASSPRRPSPRAVLSPPKLSDFERPSFSASAAVRSFQGNNRPYGPSQGPRYRMEQQFNGDYKSVPVYDRDNEDYRRNPAADENYRHLY